MEHGSSHEMFDMMSKLVKEGHTLEGGASFKQTWGGITVGAIRAATADTWRRSYIDRRQGILYILHSTAAHGPAQPQMEVSLL